MIFDPYLDPKKIHLNDPEELQDFSSNSITVHDDGNNSEVEDNKSDDSYSEFGTDIEAEDELPEISCEFVKDIGRDLVVPFTFDQCYVNQCKGKTVVYLPEQLCQGKLDSWEGSNACVIISL